MIKKESPFLLDKAKFKSRRGLNELDQILVPFVTEKFQQLDEIDKILFLELLEFEDVDLADLILYKKIKSSEKFFAGAFSSSHNIPVLISNFLAAAESRLPN